MQGPRGASVAVHVWVVSYDISDDSDRNRIAELLEGWGRRIQFSVFECRLTERQMKRLRGRVRRLADPRRDSVRWYPLCFPCAAKGFTLGADIERDAFGGEGFSIV